MTTASKHTPGKWTIRKNGTRLIIEGPNSRMVAETLEYIPSDGEAEANARLIASAPELLAGLKDTVEALRRSTQHVPENAVNMGIALHAPIADARTLGYCERVLSKARALIAQAEEGK